MPDTQNHSMRADELVNNWVEAFNRRDVDRIVDYYEEDAVNHQAPESEARGKRAIRQMFKDAFETAEMHCIVENIFVDGDWAILEWSDPLGLTGCGFFHVPSGKIRTQRGYWDKLTFLKIHGLPIPS